MRERTEQGVCEYGGVTRAEQCGEPAIYRYPAMGGGFMRLCEHHGRRFLPHGITEQWDGMMWDSVSGGRDAE